MKKEKLYHIINEYIKQDKRSDLGKENANFIRSISVLEHLLVSEVNKNYLFDEVYKELPILKELCSDGFIYHHQTSRLSPYCIGLSSYDIAMKGLRSNATNERSSSPPKRIDTLLSQCANLICLLSQEVSGATSLNDLSSVVAGYLYYLETKLKKKVTDDELRNYWQSFLYNVNLPFRSGNSPFSNITLDFSKCAATLAGKSVVYAGNFLDITYRDIPYEFFDRVNKAFIDAMNQGDSIGNPFTFPLVTVNIDDNFDYNNECWKYFLEKSENFGGFYVQNYCTKPFNEEARKENPYHVPYDIGMLYSNCCRMVFDLKELLGVSGCNPFASSSGVGGIGVITINLNRLMWLCQKDTDLLYKMLDVILELSAAALEKKREWVRKNWKILYSYLSYYVKDDKTLFSIISLCGAHEGLISMGYKDGIYNTETKQFMKDLMLFIRNKLDELTKKYQSVFSLEYAPGETASCKLAQKDLLFYKKVVDEQITTDEISNKYNFGDDLSKKFYTILNKALNSLREESNNKINIDDSNFLTERSLTYAKN
jgi:anaerobic ribonucleoside-triphosphate reductase